ncbi:hypothetical protein CVT25_011966 [Psilocybe cyanescens]|uniref:Uncharacterized protein n=1 Tax=Psilocybe cyanescens TaxID=93625 RepID=A0A409XV17_PSICY|nr:hypothetical protein CVT25_011966 [Psilocybe cyanescens]
MILTIQHCVDLDVGAVYACALERVPAVNCVVVGLVVRALVCRWTLFQLHERQQHHNHEQPRTLPAPTPISQAKSNLASAHAAAFAAAATAHVPLPLAPVYDLAHVERLSCPFLKRTLSNASRPNSHLSSSNANACASSSSSTETMGAASTKVKRRRGSGQQLRVVAAANNAGRMRSASTLLSPESDGEIAQG